MIRWFARNDLAANFLLATILFAGVYTALNRVPLQVAPSRVYNSIIIRMEYRGGTAKDVEKSIIIPIEEALQDLAGIETLWARASRGGGFLWLSLKDGVDNQQLLDEVKEQISRINTFPSETEEPRIYLPDSDRFHEIIRMAVTGDLSELELRRATEKVRDDLVAMDGISHVDIDGSRPFEISIEADQEKLRAYGLSFQDISDAIARFSVDLPAGSINSADGNVNVRAIGQAYTTEDYAHIPIRAENGADVLVGEVARVDDGFEEGKELLRFNGAPAMMIEVMRHDDESAIKIARLVHEYAATAGERFPPGINLYPWDDEAVAIQGRLGTLGKSLVQGCLLVFILLALFLRPMLAFWVVIGIPVSFAGGILMMPLLGLSANLMSVFGFIIVVGLVVDDAIVTGENIFSHLKEGMDPLEAAVVGTKEVAVPVTFGVLTTIVAFMPMLFFEGHWSSYAKQIPPVVAPVLVFSLIESKLVLPSHLKHLKTGRTRLNPLSRIQKRIADGLETFVKKVYQPTLVFSLRHRYAVASLFLASALLMLGYCQSGKLGFVTIPHVDRMRITARLHMPRGTKIEQTDQTIRRITAAVETLRAEFVDEKNGRSLITNVYESSGERGRGGGLSEHEGRVSIEILAPELRSDPGVKNSVIANRWQEIVGEIPAANHFSIRSDRSGDHRRSETREAEPMEIELRGPGSEQKIAIAHQVVELLKSYEGISAASTDVQHAVDELEITLKPRAAELRLNQQILARQIRQAFYGQEAQRLQRGRDDVRVMVRLTEKERKSLHTLDTLKVQVPGGTSVSLSSVADIKRVKVPASIERIDGSEVVEIVAHPADETTDIMGIAAAVGPEIQQLLNEGENLSYRFTGFVAENVETKRRTIIGSVALFFALYMLLAIPFKSLVQPIFVLLAVPFGIIGALLGHIIMDITPSYLSVFGMLALAGVVVNDSLVMVDFVNKRRAEGMPLHEAIVHAGSRRFRAILLTSLTTFAGLMPLMFDSSIQGQFLIPMAVSLGYGILFATFITLYLIPSAYQISEDLGKVLGAFKRWYLRPFAETE